MRRIYYFIGNTKSAAEAKEQWTTYYYNRYPSEF